MIWTPLKVGLLLHTNHATTPTTVHNSCFHQPPRVPFNAASFATTWMKTIQHRIFEEIECLVD